jgi:gamma-glutamyltranspeptidase / glutathione hydrolase
MIHSLATTISLDSTTFDVAPFALTRTHSGVVRMIKFITTFLLLITASVAFAAGGVVSSADRRASEAGREMLRAGGSATDAALAMMLALTVVEPQSSGIGGGGFLVHHDGVTGKVATIDGREMAPAAAKPGRFLGADGKPMPFTEAFHGGLSVGVPGEIALMADAHKKWGKLPWARLFAPAIHLAEDGFKVTPRLRNFMYVMKDVWPAYEDAKALYWQDGAPKPVGTLIRNPALAALLKQMAARGPKAFYRGSNARAISAAAAKSAHNPAIITPRDIAGYRTRDRDAVCAPYRQYRLCGMGPPSSGATTVFQILGMLERFDLKALGPNDARSWHLIAEAMFLAYADRDKYLGDPDFVDVPVKGLLDRAYIARRSALVSPDTSLPRYEAGTPPGAPKRTSAVPGETAGTTHFVAVDGSGNIASMTTTIEMPFGSQLMANGYFLNNELTDFSFAPVKDGAPAANQVRPGKRPMSSMSPTIVYGPDGKPVFAVGAAGGARIIMQVAKTLIAHLDWGLSPRDAIAAPNIFFGGDGVIVETGTPLAAMAGALAGYGRVVVTGALLPSKANAAERTDTGWHGAADPRSEGVALEEDAPLP